LETKMKKKKIITWKFFMVAEL